MKFSIRLFSARTVLIAFALILGGCSNFTIFPGIHRIEIHQGNIIDQKMVNKLKVGMTRSQVSFVLGTPLVADPFNQDQWNYYYSRKDADGNVRSRSYSVFFENDLLSSFDGEVALPRYQTPTDQAQDDDEEEKKEEESET